MSMTVTEGGEETWIETQSDNGKCYYYNAKTRETTWTKPVSALVLTQEQFLQKVLANQNQAIAANNNGNAEVKDPTNAPVAGVLPILKTQAPQALAGPPSFLPTGLPRPPFPFPVAVPGAWPPVIPQQQQSSLLASGADQLKQQLLTKIDPQLRLQASEWSEHKTPEGKVYFYNLKNQQSVWTKPDVLIKLDEALENVKKVDELAGKNENKEVSPQPKKEEEKKPEVRDQSKPISRTAVPGTPWCVVWTGDKRVFFFNPSTNTSLWECPAELANHPDVPDMIKEPPKPKSEQNNSKRASSERQVSSEPEPKKVKLNEEKVESNKKETNNNSEVEDIAAKKREALPLEERIKMFKAMLLEKEVSAFSTWEKELHKIVFDERYLLLISKERKQVFEQFMKERAEEERKEKRQKQKLYREQFRQLLEEANLSSRSFYSEFSLKHSKDSRFRNISKSRDRETIFNDFLNELKKREREQKEKQREEAKTNFLELLKEKDFITSTSLWSEVKDKLRDDARYRALESNTTKEIIFNEFVSRIERNVDKDKVDQEISETLKKKEKMERIEASLRERKKEVHKELAEHMREADKEREQHLHAETVDNFNALLVDLVRSPQLTWHEVKKMLKKDHRWEMVSSLDRSERERLFEKHIAALIKKKRDRFHQMLDSIKDLSLSASWREIRRSVKDDPRYKRFSSSDRKCEREFNDYLANRLIVAKNEFRELLRETKLITSKTKTLIEDSDQHLQDIIATLQNDKRYLVLEQFADDRRLILNNYISELGRAGASNKFTTSNDSSKRR